MGDKPAGVREDKPWTDQRGTRGLGGEHQRDKSKVMWPPCWPDSVRANSVTTLSITAPGSADSAFFQYASRLYPVCCLRRKWATSATSWLRFRLQLFHTGWFPLCCHIPDFHHESNRLVWFWSKAIDVCVCVCVYAYVCVCALTALQLHFTQLSVHWEECKIQRTRQRHRQSTQGCRHKHKTQSQQTFLFQMQLLLLST